MKELLRISKANHMPGGLSFAGGTTMVAFPEDRLSALRFSNC
jgi:hypothetical protein